jgi:hypothetical protein
MWKFLRLAPCPFSGKMKGPSDTVIPHQQSYVLSERNPLLQKPKEFSTTSKITSIKVLQIDEFPVSNNKIIQKS